MADDQVDISGMPPPPAAQSDPTTNMPSPRDLYKQYWSYNPAVDTDNIPQDKLDDFMANPPPRHVPASEQLSALTGAPKVLAEANPITPRIAGWAGRVGALTGSAAAALDPTHASEHLAEGARRANDWSANAYKFFGYLPGKLATKGGDEMAERALAAPGQAISAIAGTAGSIADALTSGVDIDYDDQGNPIEGPGGITHKLSPLQQENISTAANEVAGGLASTLGIPDIKGTPRAISRNTERVRAALLDKGIFKPTEADLAAGYTPKPKQEEPTAPLKPDNIGTGVTGEQLRSRPNPIPPPDDTVSAARAKVKVPPRMATVNPAPEVQSPAPRAAAGDIPPTGAATLPDADAAPLDMNLSPDERAIVREGVAARRTAADTQRGSVRLFSSPAEEGPKETPIPALQNQRQEHLNNLDKLSGGLLPTRRISAVTGDYNATGDDYQAKEVEKAGGPMKTQIASENAALHTGAEAVHSSLDSAYDNSVDPQTVSNRGRTVRNAVEAIQKHFEDATDGFYEAARAANQGRPIPKLQRVSDYLNDDSNFTNDAEIGLQRAAKQRLERLWTTGDPDKGAPPGSINAAERLREFFNEKGKNPNAMGVAGDLKNHLDMDVADHGGPGMFEAARKMRRHSYQMLEEPTGIKKLLAPSDSQGINHAVPTEKVADYVADLPQEQHEHVLNVLRAGAHLDPEIAEKSAAALREIQAHVVSRIHDAATDKASGAWNARKFYNSAAEYGPKMSALFQERPDVIKHLQTLNDAGNALHMDKHYPGAAAQAERTGLGSRALEVGGNLAASLAHEIPVVGRFVGRGIENAVEKTTGQMSETARDRAVAQRLVDRSGKQRGSVQAIPAKSIEGQEGVSDESVNRFKSDLAAGRTTHIIDPDGNHEQLTHPTDVDRPAPKGSVKYQKGVGILDRGGLPPAQANGLVARAEGLHGFDKAAKPQTGSQLNIGLHQGQEGQPGFRKMSKQEATGAVESTGAKVTKSSVLTPDQHGVYEPTMVASTNRALSEPEMQKILAKTKQSAIPQRTAAGEESMHVAPGHEEIAKKEGWDKFNPDYFREHDGKPMASPGDKQRGSVRVAYHATNSPIDFDELDPSHSSELGVHVGTKAQANAIARPPSAAWSEAGPRIMPVRVDTKKSLRMPDLKDWNIPAVSDELAKRGLIPETPFKNHQDVVKFLQSKGYDSIIYKNRIEGLDDNNTKPQDSRIIFNKSQIKSALSSQRGSVRVMNEKPLAGAPEGDKPNGKARGAAAAYKRSAGIDTPPLKEYRFLDPKAAKNVADAYEEMKHDPTDPKVAKSYAAFKAETLAQYKQMTRAGMKVDLDPSYPYTNPREMHSDVRDNNHMSIYPTEAGFGSSDAAAADHPLMEKAPVKMGGKDATYNDLFRAVHDYYGHAAEGNGFRANGEYNAWRAHRQMYSEAARGAMDAETLGQNSWVNSGPAGVFNKGASSADTIFADQKAGLLPRDVVKSAEEGVGADEHHITNQLTDKERNQLQAGTSKRLVDAFNSAPATKEYAAAALAGAAKRGWYRNSAQAIVNQFGHEAPRFAGLLAAMSPQVSVQTNFANALKTYINWDKAGRPENPADIRQIMEDSSQRSAKNTDRSNVLDAWFNNGVRALTADDPTNIKLSGPKVHSFYNNLIDNVHEVTNDAWMSAFSKVDPAKLGGALNQSGPGKSPTYLALSGKVREAARTISHLTGETWTPAEVQETVWSWAKTAYEHAEEKGSNVSIPDLVKNGDITDELIRSTPDFHQLFSTSEHRGLLQSSRFAGNAEGVDKWQSQGADTAGSSEARKTAAASLRPHLISAAERLESLRQERRASGKSAPKEE
jgi:hypothetical protein